MPDYAVSTTFKANDQVSKAFRQMSRSVDRFSDRTSRAFRDSSRQASRFGDIVKGILSANVIQRGIGTLNTGIRIAAENFVSLDDAAMGALARFGDLSKEGEDLWKNLDRVKGVAREVGLTTEYTATQAAMALEKFAIAGFDFETSMKMVKIAIDTATAAGEDFVLVTDWTSDLLGGFQLITKDSAQQIKNYARLTDVMVNSAMSANVTMETLFETFKVAAPITKAYGAGLEEAAALAAILGSAGLKGGEGATILKNMLTRLAAPNAEVVSGLDMLNLQIEDLQDNVGNMRPIADVLEILSKAQEGLTRPQRLGALRKLSGMYALAGVSILGKSVDQLREFIEKNKEAAGTVETTADIMRKSLGRQLQLLGSGLIGLGDTFFKVFEVDARTILPRFIKFIQNSRDEVEVFAKTLRGVFGLVGAMFKEDEAVQDIRRANRERIMSWFRGKSETNGTVDVNFNNAPAGTTVETSGAIPEGININREALGVIP